MKPRAAPFGPGRGDLRPIIGLFAGMAILAAAHIDAVQAQGVTLHTPPRPSVAVRSSPDTALPGAPTSFDIRVVRAGNKLAMFVGKDVFDEASARIGVIRDLIIIPNESAAFAVVSVGDFLGVGSYYAVVSFSALRMRGTKIILRSATKKSLKALPAYKYPT